MSLDREDIEEAIEVLEDASAEMLMETGEENYYSEAIAVLRQALGTEQDPVAWISDSPTKGNGKQLHWTKSEAWRWSSSITPLYTAPQKQWVGLTDDEMEALFLNEDGVRFARYIESRLKDKNA
jgi:hypothetical protein